jgi:tRNA pseudouridine38-40 synthase
MPRYALDLEFDGRAFLGTQAQAQGLRTLHAVVSEAVAGLDGGRPIVRFASRLDTGVSAEHFPVDTVLARDWDLGALAAAMTSRLPMDVVCTRAARVDDSWHVRRDARSKRYRYDVALRPTRPVVDSRAAWVRQLDRVDLLPEMAAMLVGHKDLSGFATLRHDDTDEDDPHREILSATWTREERPLGSYLVFRVVGEGFLYRQVRGMVGAMLHVAKGREALDSFAAAVAGGRSAARLGNIAPAHGLTLERVVYDPEPGWQAPSP